ncbi:MAG TPA: hypothetical protein VMB26_16380, partial [Candidatus Binataceae bacterium]|nr:hypothetical protein [Candidatus Binataceae bacterium]
MDLQSRSDVSRRANRRAAGRARLGATAILGFASFAILAVAIATSSQAQLAQVSSSWPMFHHDLEHT